jgi:hypothetical protein
MEQIIQLKTMRDEALERLQNNPDFKLVNSLDALIRDLESVLAPVASVVEVQADSEENVAQAGAEDVNVEAIADEETTSDDAALKTGVDAEIEELAVSDPEAVTSAIEALEAELSQATSESDNVTAQPGSMIN